MKDETKISHHNNIVEVDGKQYYVIESKIRFKLEEKIDKLLVAIVLKPNILLKEVADVNVHHQKNSFSDENGREIRMSTVHIFD